MLDNKLLTLEFSACLGYQCYRRYTRRRAGVPGGVPLTTTRRSRRPWLGKNVMTLSQVNVKFPAINYRIWNLKKPRSERSISGVASTPVSRHASTEDVTRSMSLPDRLTHPCNAVDDNSKEWREKEYDLDVESLAEPRQAAPQVALPERPKNVVIAHAVDDHGIHDSAALSVSSNEDADTCAVCLTEFDDGDDIRGLTCGHAFHVACIDSWLSTRRACCPICIADMAV